MIKDYLTLKVRSKWIAMVLAIISGTFILGLPHFYVKNVKGGVITLIVVAAAFYILRFPASEPFVPVMGAVYFCWQLTTILYFGTMDRNDFNTKYNSKK